MKAATVMCATLVVACGGKAPPTTTVPVPTPNRAQPPPSTPLHQPPAWSALFSDGGFWFFWVRSKDTATGVWSEPEKVMCRVARYEPFHFDFQGKPQDLTAVEIECKGAMRTSPLAKAWVLAR